MLRLVFPTAGVRMRYPTAFVLMSSEAETELARMHGGGGSVAGAGASAGTPGGANMMPLTPPQSPTTCHHHLGSEPPLSLLPQQNVDVFLPVLDEEGSGALGQRLVEKVWHDCTVSSGTSAQG